MTLGIIGGCGPLVSAHFLNQLYEMTDARGDADYPDLLLSSISSTPDRTAYLLDPCAPDPTPALLRAATTLAYGGADILFLLCYTAHAFLPTLRARLSVPILDLVSIGMQAAAQMGITRLGVLCSLGTRHARLLEGAAAPLGIRLLYPPLSLHTALQGFIYQQLKRGKGGDGAPLLSAALALADKGAEALLLACTELSLLHACPSYSLPIPCLDPLSLLAARALDLCGKTIKEAYRYDAAWRPAFFSIPDTHPVSSPVG